jgi:glycosyltransferase involved in cell wall biosynthesis
MARQPSRLIVTVDLERDLGPAWEVLPRRSFRAVLEALPRRLAPLLARHGVRPTLFLGADVLLDPACTEALARQDAELGTHLHGEYLPPHAAAWLQRGEPRRLLELQADYPPDVERAKLGTLTELFCQQLGRRPTAFRAGRFGPSRQTGRLLRELGYAVDASVVPGLVLRDLEGRLRPDHRGLPEAPYWMGPDGDPWSPGQGGILELPATLAPPGALGPDPAWLRPELSDSARLEQVARRALAVRDEPHDRPLVVVVQVQALVRGASPLSATEEAVEEVLRRLDGLLGLARALGIEARTASEYAEERARVEGRGVPGGRTAPGPAPATLVAPSPAPGPDRPRVLLIADVPRWIFERHCLRFKAGLSDEFDFDVKYVGQPFDEADYDLVYPLEWSMVDHRLIREPRKYVTGVRSHISWDHADPAVFGQHLRTHFQRVHVVSRRLERLLAPHAPVAYLTHGVDAETFRAAAPPRPATGRLRLGWAGNRKSTAKGFEEFIEPLARLPGVELAFCGYSDKNLEQADMIPFYEGLDAYVCSSSTEGNNNSLLEAAAMERAIITTDVGTVPEYLVDGQSALIVERRPEAFRRAVERLRDEPGLAASLGRAARRGLLDAGFSWATKLEEHRSFFRAAVAQARGGPPRAALCYRSRP